MVKSKAQLNNEYVLLSMNLLETIIKGGDTKNIQAKLEVIPADTLAKYLFSDEQKNAFWINIYNSFIQIRLSKNPEYFENRAAFFRTPLMIIAGKSLSFDDIEHGIIRGSKFKFSLGLIKNPFANEYEKKLRTRKEDGRVHFALNCGAKSCPLVAVYDAQNFNSKINEVASSFLNKMSTYNQEENKVSTTPLFSWFRGDFNGKSGIRDLLKQYGIVPKNSNPKIEYTGYDWTLSLANYYEK
ncbi:MAG: DUF547 domain-containing protein [Flavobacteriales bacterium]|nr:DUF547 domain-containing protein [Flavobacteriales bacterium]